MSLGFNLLICSVLLVLSGLPKRLIDQMSMPYPEVCGMLMLMVLCVNTSDIRLFGDFYINIGGFILPTAFCCMLLYSMEKGERLPAVWGAVLCGGASFLFYEIMANGVDMLFASPAYFHALCCMAFSMLLQPRMAQGMVSMVFGFYLSGVISYIDQAVGASAASLALGSGTQFDALFLCTLVLVLCYRLYTLLSSALKMSKPHKKQTAEG